MVLHFYYSCIRTRPWFAQTLLRTSVWALCELAAVGFGVPAVVEPDRTGSPAVAGIASTVSFPVLHTPEIFASCCRSVRRRRCRRAAVEVVRTQLWAASWRVRSRLPWTRERLPSLKTRTSGFVYRAAVESDGAMST
jgi:hypothetical protein